MAVTGLGFKIGAAWARRGRGRAGALVLLRPRIQYGNINPDGADSWLDWFGLGKPEALSGSAKAQAAAAAELSLGVPLSGAATALATAAGDLSVQARLLASVRARRRTSRRRLLEIGRAHV